ncbi:SCP2 sterol-binding domain-containing protein [Neolewinella antarctica]|uniref:Sterol carrier protein n=1 Tax=Neolewinella antarctica TaxID=442734 RepID=A0ABX0XCB4_9BACT|nr:SCP2 sterol-binding domain-containing protein [Neolewinella antarctica]NJC26857.1 putative sterol carrier protein [Neolewinella antarctica]
MTFEEFKEGVTKAGAKAPNLGKSLKLSLDEGTIFIDMTNDGGAVVTEDDKEADTVVTTDVDTLDQLRTGKLNPMMAMMGGKVKIKGDMGLAMKLQSLLS